MDEQMNITSAQWIDGDNSGSPSYLKVSVDGREVFVPKTTQSKIYAEILRQVEAGTLTIQDAD